jgi:hypothetical protein
MAVRELTEKYLNLIEPIDQTNSVEYLEYHDFNAKKEYLNENGSKQITIDVDLLDEAILLQDSMFIFKVKITKKDGKDYTDTDEIAFSNNGIMHMFEQVQLKIDGIEIESYNYPGILTTVYGLLAYNYGYSKTSGLMQCWSLDTEAKHTPQNNTGFKSRGNLSFGGNNNGSYTFIIPFSHIFGDCKKIIKGAKITVVFTRNPTHDNHSLLKDDTKIGGTGGDKDNDKYPDGKILFQDFIFRVSVPKLNPTANASLLEYLSTKPHIYFQFNVKHLENTPVLQSQKFNWDMSYSCGPDRLNGAIVCFQTGKDNKQTINSSMFDNLEVDDGCLTLNGTRYPGNPLNGGQNFGEYNENFSRYLEFRKLFTKGICELEPEDFDLFYTLYCFDFSHQKVRTHGESYRINVNFKFKNAAPKNTNCYCILFSDKTMSFTTYGDNKMKTVRI